MQPQPYGRLVYPTPPGEQGTTTSPQINASLSGDSWHTSSLLPQDDPSPSSHSSHMFPLSTRTPDQMDYSLSPGFLSSHHVGTYDHHRPQQSSHPTTPAHNDMPPVLTPVDTTLGTGRVLTRRQRALLIQNGRRFPQHSPVSVGDIETNVVRVFVKLPSVKVALTISPIPATLPCVFHAPRDIVPSHTSSGRQARPIYLATRESCCEYRLSRDVPPTSSSNISVTCVRDVPIRCIQRPFPFDVHIKFQSSLRLSRTQRRVRSDVCFLRIRTCNPIINPLPPPRRPITNQPPTKAAKATPF